MLGGMRHFLCVGYAPRTRDHECKQPSKRATTTSTIPLYIRVSATRKLPRDRAKYISPRTVRANVQINTYSKVSYIFSSFLVLVYSSCSSLVGIISEGNASSQMSQACLAVFALLLPQALACLSPSSRR